MCGGWKDSREASLGGRDGALNPTRDAQSRSTHNLLSATEFCVIQRTTPRLVRPEWVI